MNTKRTVHRPRTAWYTGLLTLAALAATPLTHGAGMLIAEGGMGGRLDIVEHSVEVILNNGIAVTTVDQTFRNKEQRIVEALYTFPIPRGASVSDFTMWIAGKEMVGEVLEKERAREIYNSYKRVKRDPGLLEQNDFRSFEMRIFPIAAGADQRVRISYSQEVSIDHDRGTYVYPLATRTRPGEDSRVQGPFRIQFHLKSAIPVNAVTSPSHPNDFVMADHSANYHEASLEQPAGNLAGDVVLNWDLSRPKTGVDLITSKQKGEDGYFLMTLTVGEDLQELDTGMDYVFLLDTSGSMSHDRKLPVSRRTIQAFIETLAPEDRFEVLSFNVTPKPLFQSLRAANEEGLKKAQSFLGSRMAQGGTRLVPAMQAAYKYADSDRPLNVVVVSDGLTEGTDLSQLSGLIASRPASARVFCLGVGNDINRPLLESTATQSGGLAAFLSESGNFDAQAKAFRRKLTRPAVSDLVIEVDGIDLYDLEPRTLPNLYHGAPVRLYGRYRGTGEAEVKVRGTVMGREFKVGGPVTFENNHAANPELERMWAWKRIDGLLKEADAAGTRDRKTVDEVIRLGEGYSIVTKYTSFLVLENEQEFRRWNIDRKNKLRLARDHRSRSELRNELETIREKALADIGPVSTKPTPQKTTASKPSANNPTPTTRPNQRRSQPTNGFDMPDFGSGPVGPFLLVGAAWLARRRRRQA